jgi:hypothetical protein
MKLQEVGEHCTKLRNLYSSPIRITTSRRVRWAGHVARMGRRGMHIGYSWVDNIKMDLRDIGWNGMDWIDLVQDRDPVGGSCEHGNEPSGSIKCWEVLEWLHNWWLLKKGSAP